VELSKKPSSSGTIEISVVVPVRDEEDSVRELLQGLLSQTLPPNEIVITDSGSIDATREIIEEFIRRGAPITLICETAALPGRGRNVAVAHSRCDWIAFIDAGTIPERDWLEHLAKPADSQSDVDVVYGTYEPVTDSLFKLCAVMAYVAPPYEIDGRLIRSCSVVSALMKRSVWEQVGGFPEHLRSAEDLLFMRKIEGANFKIVRAPEALVHWQVQADPWQTFKRFVRYARNNMRAGLWLEWQAPLFKRYGLLLVTLLPAIILGGKWLLVTLLLWILFLAARAVVAVKRNQVRYPAGIAENALRLVVLTPLIALLDAATTIGTLQWAVKDRWR
jgi:cellulose synthase/poly-beta-1,6-N-acetylglucosamine synthase-like glycosyltransferase